MKDMRHLLQPLLLSLSLIVSSGCTAQRSERDGTTATGSPAAMGAPSEASTAQAAATPAVSPAVPPAAAEPAAARQPQAGSVVPGPANIRRFSPAESALAVNVPADQVDLRKIFEELGSDAALWYQHVQTLSNPFFEGRAPGTRGDELTAEYLEFYFRTYGLEPAFPSEAHQMGSESVKAFTSYRQRFDFASPNPDVKVIEAAASIDGQGLIDGKQFTILGNSGSGDITAPVTFVGYAIAEGQDGYTSFDENIDLSGRIALVLRYEPLDDEGKSQWSRARFSRFSGIAAKMRSVAERGAAGVILVNPPGALDGKTELESLKESGRFGRRLEIPVVQVTPEVASRILRRADPQQRDLLTWRKLADRGEVKSVHLDDSVQVAITSDLEVDDRLNTYNVAGVLRGKGSLAEQWIVIGAHYDHLGYGYTGTAPTNVGQLHAGADDNASGTAGVLIAARRLAAAYADAGQDANLRSIAFVLFGAEEAGLHGSKYFVENSPITASATSLMINMDMIGRLRSSNLLMQGSSSAQGLADLLQPHIEKSGLKISAMPGGRGPSDHSNFYAKQIPVLFMFTGEHAEYHKPTDLAHTVNPAGAMKVLDLLHNVVMDVAARAQQLRFAAVGGAPEGPARNTGARVSLGTMPDYTAELETGMRVESVRDGSSAADAGIRGGDILLTWNGQELTGPAKLAEFLGKHEPGDVVKIFLRRGEQEIEVEVTLQGRAAQ